MALVQTHTGQDARKLPAMVPHTISSLALCRMIQNLTVMCTYILLHDTMICITIPISQMKKLMLILNDLHIFIRPITQKILDLDPRSIGFWSRTHSGMSYSGFGLRYLFLWQIFCLQSKTWVVNISGLQKKKYLITAQVSSQ